MNGTVLKVARIGNSRGIRLPAALLRKYHITDSLIAEEKPDKMNAPAQHASELGSTARRWLARGLSEWDTAQSLDVTPQGPLDPAGELRKTRPAVIVSLDPLNRALETVVVCPLTGQLHPGWRTRLQVKVGGKKSEIAADQIRVVSKIGGGNGCDAMPRARGDPEMSATVKPLLRSFFCAFGETSGRGKNAPVERIVIFNTGAGIKYLDCYEL